MCGDDCQMEYYIGCNHHYTPARENRGKGVLKRVFSEKASWPEEYDLFARK
ncbi:uncharacterized protein METZ01_LOCUS378349 [marine metagenome]|uniref:Uncharacterized protein n=1 Tax=marine metagenome TaxID=408172 RepID=A0A382TUW1_9ZZZZ